jgi:hypothetical protein
MYVPIVEIFNLDNHDLSWLSSSNFADNFKVQVRCKLLSVIYLSV